jgi:hypothetical protein
MSTSVRILSLRAQPIAVGVIVAVIIVVIVIAIGSRCCGAGGYTISCTAPTRIIPSRVTRNRTARASCNRTTRIARSTGTTRYRMRRPNTSCDAIAASAVNTPGVNGTAPEVSRAHATAVEATSAHAASVKSSASKPTTTAATSKGVVGNEAGTNQNERCHSSKNVAKHGVPPLFWGAVHCSMRCRAYRHPAINFVSHRVPN